MSDQLYPTDLTDRQWEYIKPLIPAAKPGGRPRTTDMRQLINAMLYLVVSGAQWRLLPREYPRWQTVYHYFRQWRNDGTWQRIHDTLRATVRRQAGRHKHPTAGCLDSQSVKVAALPGPRGYDAGKQVSGRKRHLVVDTLGLLLAVVVTSAAVQDRDGARLALRRLGGAGTKLRRLWVDGAYRGQLVTWALCQLRLRLTVVPLPSERRGFVVVARRWVIERTFAWLTQARRLSRDYEAMTTSSEAMIRVAMIRLMVRRLARA
jgi:putative transposase